MQRNCAVNGMSRLYRVARGSPNVEPRIAKLPIAARDLLAQQRYVFGLALMTTWLSLTTTEKSTPDALYCSMIFGAV